MIKEKAKKIISELQYEVLLYLFLMFIPYLGTAGNNILMGRFGQFSIANFEYYTIAHVVAIVFCFIAYYKNIHNRDLALNVDKFHLVYFLINGSFLLAMICFSNLSFSKFIGFGLFLISPFILSERGINDTTFKAIGFMNLAMCIFQMVLSTTKVRCFNVNLYSYLIILTGLLSLLIVKDWKYPIFKILFAAMILGAGFYVVYFTYDCKTEAIAVIIAFLLYLIRFLFKYRAIPISLFAIAIIFMIGTPIVIGILINQGHDLGGVFTSRGERWNWALNSFINSGAFICTNYDPISHNAFMDLSIKLTLQGSSLLIASLFAFCVHLMKHTKKDDDSKLIMIIMVYLIIVDITESFMFSITDWGITTFLIALLIAKKEPNNKNYLEINKNRIFNIN